MKGIIFAILGLVVWIALVKVANPEEKIDNLVVQTPAVTSKQLQMEWSEISSEGVSSDEKDRLVEFVDTFESAIVQHDSDKVLSFFSEPETDEERQELNFILGSDYARDGAKPLARLFTTAGYNYSLSAHYVRSVSAQGANRRVLVDEMRIIRSSGEWAGTVANVSRLVIELRETSHGYQITRYYHDGEKGKYSGFIAK